MGAKFICCLPSSVQSLARYLLIIVPPPLTFSITSSMSLDASFETYEEEFQSLTSQLQCQLGSQGKDKAVEQGTLKGLFSQCDSILKQMSIEVRNIDDVEREEFLARVELYRIQLHILKQHFGERSAETKRNELGFNNVPQTNYPKEGLSTRSKLNQQNATLERARRTVADAEETAGIIAEELHRNRSAIERSHDKVAEVSDLTNDASKMLSRMKRWF